MNVQDRPQKSLERQIRAFHHVRLLAELPRRLAGTAAEREAAERVEVFLRDVGFEEVAHTAVASRPRPAGVRALHLGTGALACALGGPVGLALAVLAAFSRARDVRGGPVARWLPAPDSANVAARAGTTRPRRRVVLSAPLDAPLRVRFAPVVRGLARALDRAGAPTLRPAALTSGVLAAAVVTTAASALGAAGVPVAIARVGVGVLLAAMALASLASATGTATLGARRAAGVAALLACAEQLLARLPDDTELWVVGAGAGELGGCGLRALLESHPEWRLDRTFFVHFEDAGGAALQIVRSEGAHAPIVHPPMLRELARRVAESGGFGAVTPVDLRRDTSGRELALRHLHALSLVTTPAAGAGDRPEDLDMAGVVVAADFGAAVVTALLRGDADPLPIV